MNAIGLLQRRMVVNPEEGKHSIDKVIKGVHDIRRTGGTIVPAKA